MGLMRLYGLFLPDAIPLEPSVTGDTGFFSMLRNSSTSSTGWQHPYKQAPTLVLKVMEQQLKDRAQIQTLTQTVESKKKENATLKSNYVSFVKESNINFIDFL